jgi:hypothetical protein
MGDEDGVDQIKMEDNGVMALSEGRRVKSRRKAKTSSLTEVEHALASGVWWFHPQNHRQGLVASSSKPSVRVWWFGPQNHRWRVYGFGPQNPGGGSEEERTARGGIREFASRRSYQ